MNNVCFEGHFTHFYRPLVRRLSFRTSGFSLALANTARLRSAAFGSQRSLRLSVCECDRSRFTFVVILWYALTLATTPRLYEALLAHSKTPSLRKETREEDG